MTPDCERVRFATVRERCRGAGAPAGCGEAQCLGKQRALRPRWPKGRRRPSSRERASREKGAKNAATRRRRSGVSGTFDSTSRCWASSRQLFPSPKRRSGFASGSSCRQYVSS
ncbi:hypothetical protein ACFPRL_15405 [Pseudoclavibacter helvolus]